MSTSAFDHKRDHRITREEAASLVKGFQSTAKPGEHRASAFNRSAFEQLLAQPGAAGIRIYRASEKDGSPTVVMVAVDEKGNDLAEASSTFMENGSNCPPWCMPTSWF